MWDNLIKKIRPSRPQPESPDVRRPHGIDAQSQSSNVDVHGDETSDRSGLSAFDPENRVVRTPAGDKTEQAGPRSRRVLSCPVCAAPMVLERIGRVELDRCEKCGGIFLDRGELEQLSGRNPSSYVPSDPDSAGDRDFLIYTPHGLSDHVRDA